MKKLAALMTALFLGLGATIAQARVEILALARALHQEAKGRRLPDKLPEEMDHLVGGQLSR